MEENKVRHTGFASECPICTPKSSQIDLAKEEQTA